MIFENAFRNGCFVTVDISRSFMNTKSISEKVNLFDKQRAYMQINPGLTMCLANKRCWTKPEKFMQTTKKYAALAAIVCKSQHFEKKIPFVLLSFFETHWLCKIWHRFDSTVLKNTFKTADLICHLNIWSLSMFAYSNRFSKCQ